MLAGEQRAMLGFCYPWNNLHDPVIWKEGYFFWEANLQSFLLKKENEGKNWITIPFKDQVLT